MTGLPPRPDPTRTPRPWSTGDAVQVTPHLCRRWRERVDPAATDEQIAEIVLDHMRRLPAGAGKIKPGGDGQLALYVNIHPLPRYPRRGWRLKLTPALGDGWVAQTVTRGHSIQSNRAQHARTVRRAWSLWLDWCRERGESPIDNEAGLERLRRELDGTVTSRTSRIPVAARKATAEALGVDYGDYLEALGTSATVTTATGATRPW